MGPTGVDRDEVSKAGASVRTTTIVVGIPSPQPSTTKTDASDPTWCCCNFVAKPERMVVVVVAVDIGTIVDVVAIMVVVVIVIVISHPDGVVQPFADTGHRSGVERFVFGSDQLVLLVGIQSVSRGR